MDFFIILSLFFHTIHKVLNYRDAIHILLEMTYTCCVRIHAAFQSSDLFSSFVAIFMDRMSNENDFIDIQILPSSATNNFEKASSAIWACFVQLIPIIQQQQQTSPAKQEFTTSKGSFLYMFINKCLSYVCKIKSHHMLLSTFYCVNTANVNRC